ncbi:TspO/MBR family protein [Streptomyces sp. NPDC001549]|uniref:TspO/MBR family protein n=1 Tax=Streptomyces sp. NPDC001549 TaxID=3364586 RepID=UPI0036C6D1C3
MRSLERPSWAPPAWAFGPVRTVLYATIAIAAWLVWRCPDRPRVRRDLRDGAQRGDPAPQRVGGRRQAGGGSVRTRRVRCRSGSRTSRTRCGRCASMRRGHRSTHRPR